MTSFTESRDITNDVASVIELDKFCKERNIKFVYVNLPKKICKYEDDDISGILDFANQNTDRLLKQLGESGVKYYDMRETLHAEGMNHHEAFYRTDHHWKAETGLWAAKKILEFLRDNYNWRTNPEVLNPENFECVIYRDWFLGSEGKKITLLRTQPEDISLIYPRNETMIHYEIPDISINTSGDLSITYDMRHIESKDYYGLNPYGAYKYANHPLMKIRNLLPCCDKKILIIHESFFNCVIPFLAINIKYIDSIDLINKGLFNGSIQTYIKYNNPDAVIFTCNSGVPGSKTRKSFYLR